MNEQERTGTQVEQTTTEEPKPAIHLPRPTYWPMIMAWGVTMVLSGIVTTYYFSLAGVVVFAIALGGWIGELQHG